MGSLRTHSAFNAAITRASVANRVPGTRPFHNNASFKLPTLIAIVLRAGIIVRATAAPFHAVGNHSSINDVTRRDVFDDCGHILGRFTHVIFAIILVLLGGVFSGLTIAFMSQDETYLHVIATSGEVHERKYAALVLCLLRKGKHWVLVTLLLGNVLTNETLPIILNHTLGDGFSAVLCSTVLIVIFGEIAPQAICVRFGLSIGAFFSPLVLALMYLISPVSWPIAKLLDNLLGDSSHGTLYNKPGLKALIRLHYSSGIDVDVDRLSEDEVTIISNVLDLKEKSVGAIMIPIKTAYTLSADTILDKCQIAIILAQGYSRIPIHEPHCRTSFIGMLLVKSLLTYDAKSRVRVRDFKLRALPETRPTTSCLDVLNFFQEGKSHMMLISDSPGRRDQTAIGIVTLEDVVEALIGEEIVDESDVCVGDGTSSPHTGIRAGNALKMDLTLEERQSMCKKDSVCEMSEVEGEESTGSSQKSDMIGGRAITENTMTAGRREKVVWKGRLVRGASFQSFRSESSQSAESNAKKGIRNLAQQVGTPVSRNSNSSWTSCNERTR